MQEWRLILDDPAGGQENMAIDESMLIACENSLSTSTVRFYGWSQPTLSLGCFQKIGAYKENCDALGIPIVRRITGGRAVLHDMELTYAIASDDAALFEKGIVGAYRIISDCMAAAIKDLGIDAFIEDSRPKAQDSRLKNQEFSCFKSVSRYEILINGKKIVGSAQKRLKRAFLQHGSIIMDVNRGMFSSVFGKNHSIDGLSSYVDIDKDALIKSILKRFEHGLSIKLISGELTSFETDLKHRLIEDKYKDDCCRLQVASKDLKLGSCSTGL
ncbi:MAG: lipoate--protein ligase family protein [Deltaproteobacteria bacterium]|nr:lipoate--protein ligase family protein [Deltaproteobacteria bacterium]